MKNKHAQKLGKLGGQKTLEKYGKRKLKEWGKLGGRPPKKDKSITESLKIKD